MDFISKEYSERVEPKRVLPNFDFDRLNDICIEFIETIWKKGGINVRREDLPQKFQDKLDDLRRACFGAGLIGYVYDRIKATDPDSGYRYWFFLSDACIGMLAQRRLGDKESPIPTANGIVDHSTPSLEEPPQEQTLTDYCKEHKIPKTTVHTWLSKEGVDAKIRKDPTSNEVIIDPPKLLPFLKNYRLRKKRNSK